MTRFTYVAACLLGISALAFGQATEGTILGTITDSSGAAAPGASVTITNAGTGVARTTTTDGGGDYVVTNLPLGVYLVAVEKPGFKKATHPPVEITVKARVRVDLPLVVGEAAQTVEVVGSATQLRTDSAEVSGIIARQTLEDLPILNRNFLAAAALVPGTTGGPRGDRRREMSGESLTIAGTGSDANNFVLDGISNNMEFNGTIGVVPAIDAIQEFAVQTSQYSAEFGRGAGGVVNVAVKSGTNRVHGFAYDYLRNDKLDARPYDFTGTGVAKQPLRRNQFGFGLGGPIRRNRLFLFGNLEGIRFPNNSLSQGVVPTKAEKTGDFSRSGFVIADPNTTVVDPANAARRIRTPFPGNAIAASRFNPITVRLLGFIPEPNYLDPDPRVRNNYLSKETNLDRSDSINLKTDYQIHPRTALTARYSTQLADRLRESWLPERLAGATAVLDGTNAGITLTQVLGPATVHEFRTGYNFTNYSQFLLYNNNVLDEFRIPGIASNPPANGFPTLAMRNFRSTGATRPIASSPVPLLKIERSFQFMDNWSRQRSGHALKLGAEFTRVRSERTQGTPGNATLNFDSSYTTPVVGQNLEALRTGLPDGLLGLASGFTTQYVLDMVRMRQSRFSWFAQDYWRVTRKLTVSLGLRHDLYTPYGELRDRVANFDLQTGERLLVAGTRPLVASVLGIPDGNLPASYRYTDRDRVMPRTSLTNLGPRAGFSYSLRDRLVLRGGYGIFYGLSVANFASNSGVVPPFFTTLSLLGELTAPLPISSGFPSAGIVSTLSAPTLGVQYSPLDLRDPNTHKYSLNIQAAVTRRLFADIGYSGQRAGNVIVQVPRNSPTPGPGNIQTRRPFPLVGSCVCFEPLGKANYDALEMTIKLDRWKGLTAQTAFTFSKSLNYTDGSGGGPLTDPYNPRYDYGRSGFDFRRRWVSAWSYQLPSGTGLPAVARAVVSRWSASGLVTLQGGFPFSVGVSGQVLNNGLSGNRADMLRNANLPVNERTRNRWFDTGAFAVPAIYLWGNQGKNTLSGPGLARFDFAMQKQIPVAEGKAVILRMETSNLFNRVNLDLPASTLGGLNFGAIRSLGDGPRNIQIVGRFAF